MTAAGSNCCKQRDAKVAQVLIENDATFNIHVQRKLTSTESRGQRSPEQSALNVELVRSCLQITLKRRANAPMSETKDKPTTSDIILKDSTNPPPPPPWRH